MTRKRIALLGATGSIGESTLRVIRRHRQRLQLTTIAAHSSVEKLASIANEFGVRHIALFDQDACNRAKRSRRFDAGCRFYAGSDGLVEAATIPEVDMVLVAVVGTQGLAPALAAIEAGKTIALASKEILVLAGKFIMAAARRKQVAVLPVDSEHSAIFQCLQGEKAKHIKRLLLTASGGPFRDYGIEEMADIRPADALKHPNWSMGPKITVDSSTMANKGLEMIEARWLFDMQPQQVDVVIHPQSIVHSMVEFVDGSIIGQLSPPSMTFAIQHTLLFPDRDEGVEATLDFSKPFALDFRPPDLERFPCLKLARQAMVSGGGAPATFNAANEVAVDAFLAEKIEYLAISRVIAKTLERMPAKEPASLNSILKADASAREVATSLISTHEY